MTEACFIDPEVHCVERGYFIGPEGHCVEMGCFIDTQRRCVERGTHSFSTTATGGMETSFVAVLVDAINMECMGGPPSLVAMLCVAG